MIVRFPLRILIVLLLFNCKNSPRSEKEGTFLYFAKGHLSKDEFADSILNKYYSEKLQGLKEPSLKDFSSSTSYRLSVSPTHYNFYCIRVEKIDTLIRVVFKIDGDKMSFARTGLKTLTLTYESNHRRMDSLFNNVSDKVIEYDFYPGFDNAAFEAADGTKFLLEGCYHGQHRVVVGWKGSKYSGKSQYVGEKELFDIIIEMHSLVPKGLLPDLENAKEIEDVIFSILRKDSLQSY